MSDGSGEGGDAGEGGAGGKGGVARVRAALAAQGVEAEILTMDASTRTAEDAAAACGVAVAQIVKSLIFQGVESGAPYLVLVSGANRVHEKRLGRILGEKIRRADADWVREITGFAIGGVSPVGHRAPIACMIDQDLMSHGVLWAAAGAPNAVFRTDAETLQRITVGRVVDVT